MPLLHGRRDGSMGNCIQQETMGSNYLSWYPRPHEIYLGWVNYVSKRGLQVRGFLSQLGKYSPIWLWWLHMLSPHIVQKIENITSDRMGMITHICFEISMMASSNGNIFRVSGPLCGEFTGHGWIPQPRPVTWSFDVFSDLRLNKPLSKQCWGWWFEMPSCPLWRHCNGCNSYVSDWIIANLQIFNFQPKFRLGPVFC